MHQEFARNRLFFGLVPTTPLGQDLPSSQSVGRWPGAVRLALILGVPAVLWAGIIAAAGLV